MEEAQFIDLLQQCVWLILLLSAPILLTTLGVGIGISIFQAVTQIQESTLTFVPKIVVALFILLLTAPWMVQMMLDHTHLLMDMIVELAKNHR